jgi:hypothetical protein
MPTAVIAAAISAAGAIGGGLLSSKGARTGTSTSDSSWSSKETVNPLYSPLQSTLIDQAMAKLNAPVPLAGYEGNSLAAINKAYNLTGQTTNNMLSARGLSTSPIAANADISRENARAGTSATFLNNLPLLERSLKNEDWQNALTMFNSRPKETSGTGTQQATSTAPGSAAGSSISDLTSLLAYFYGSGAFGGNTNATTKTPAIGTQSLPLSQLPSFPGLSNILLPNL